MLKHHHVDMSKPFMVFVPLVFLIQVIQEQIKEETQTWVLRMLDVKVLRTIFQPMKREHTRELVWVEIHEYNLTKITGTASLKRSY
jgi:hypothetical protein